MAALYHSLFTEKGLELLRESIQNGTKLGITHMSFGDGGGTLPIPEASVMQMVNEVYRVQLNRLAPSKENQNWLEADGVIPSAVGGFNIREVGLWAGEIMVAYANYPPTYKPSGDQGTAQIKTIRIVLQIDNTANFELKIDSSIVMATIKAVEDAKSEIYKNTIATVDAVDELEFLPKWDGRTVYVRDVANFTYYLLQDRWILSTNRADSLIDSAGNSQLDINYQNTIKLVSIFDYMTMQEFKNWKNNQETFDVTFALQAAINAPGVLECLLPSGRFLYSGVYCDKHNFKLYSNARATLVSDDSTSVAFHIAKFSEYIQGVQLEGLVFQGNSNNLRCLQLGSENKAAIFTKIRNCIITGFTKDDACDVYLGSVQELDVQDTKSWNGNIGIYKAQGGYATSTRIHGKDGYIGRHAKHALKLDGQIDDIYLQDNVIEGNGLDAIVLSETAFKGTQGVSLHILNGYFESNGNSGAGSGVILANGKPDYLKLHKIFISGCNFAANLNAPANFKNVSGSNIALDVAGTSNLLPNMIGLTNSMISYHANLTVTAADIFQQLKSLEAAGNRLNTFGFNYLKGYQNGKNEQANFLSSITFPNLPVLSTDTTTLDDYREVSNFVPVVTGNGGTVSDATCKYTKVGNLVNFNIQLTTQNFTSTQGTTKVSLPHSQLIGSIAQYLNNQTYSGGVALIASKAINLPNIASQGSSSTIYITGSYMTLE